MSPTRCGEWQKNVTVLWQVRGDEQTPLLAQNLLSRRQAGVASPGCVTEPWAKKCARRNSLYMSPLPLNQHYYPSSPTEWENIFCVLVLSNFLPGSSCHRRHLWVQEEILAREFMLTPWFQHLLCKARGQPLCFCNPETARRGRWCTEKLMGKGEGEGEKAEAAAENCPFFNPSSQSLGTHLCLRFSEVRAHQAQLLISSQSLFWFALWTLLSP